MGKGLGVLQKGILCLLLDRGPLLRVRVLLSLLLGWPGIPGDNRVFNRSDIGERAYNTGTASMSRALEQLRRRGLIQVYKDVAGCGRVAGLTTFGTQVAKELAEAEREKEEAGPE